MHIEGNKLPLNNFIQETIGNIMMGFTKTLKGLDVIEPDLIEVKINQLPKRQMMQISNLPSKISFFS
jgi:hypothetical protein